MVLREQVLRAAEEQPAMAYAVILALVYIGDQMMEIGNVLDEYMDALEAKAPVGGED